MLVVIEMCMFWHEKENNNKEACEVVVLSFLFGWLVVGSWCRYIVHCMVGEVEASNKHKNNKITTP